MRIDKAIVSTGFRYFAAVAEAGSIRAAARELNIASSAVNRQVLKLEEALGMRLFDRVGRSLELTETGIVLLAEVRNTLRNYEAALDAVDALRGLQRGRVRVATVESVSVEMLPAMLSAFAADYPSIRVDLCVTGSDAVTRMVEAGDADIGFTFNPVSLDGLDVAVEMPMPIGAVVARDHPLSGKRQTTLADCCAYPVAWPARGLSLRTALDRAASAAGLQIEPVAEANSLRLMANLARTGRCIAFQTRVGIQAHLASGELSFVPLADTALPLDVLMLVRVTGKTLSPAARAFFVAAREALQDYQ